MSLPHEARVTVNNDQPTVVDTAEALLDWLTNEDEGVWVEVYDEDMKLMAMVQCSKNDKGVWKAVDVK